MVRELFRLRSSARCGATIPPVRITLPDGTTLTSKQSDHHQLLSQALGREVTLETAEQGQ